MVTEQSSRKAGENPSIFQEATISWAAYFSLTKRYQHTLWAVHKFTPCINISNASLLLNYRCSYPDNHKSWISLHTFEETYLPGMPVHLGETVKSVAERFLSTKSKLFYFTLFTTEKPLKVHIFSVVKEEMRMPCFLFKSVASAG